MSVQFQSESEVIDLSASFEFDDVEVIDDEIGPPIIPSASSSVVPSSENIPMDSNNDSSSGTYSGSDEDSSGESETDDDEEQIATFPFMNSSDSESETNGLTSTVPPPPVELDDTEIITIDDDEDENISLSDMKCDRCPNSQTQFKDKNMFRLHKERHIGHSHFVCPTCSKPFIKMSFCMAHEVRQHNRVFDFPIPLVSKALEYVKEKKEREVYDFVSNIASVVGNYVNPINPNVSAGQDEEIVYEYETDEDDPKFYPEHAVPSTSLYAYRGPELQSLYECYEIQLKFGRKRRMNTNTISRLAIAKRLELKKEGIISEADIGRFYKPQSSTRSKKRKKNSSDSSAISKTTVTSVGKNKKRVVKDSDTDTTISSHAYNPPLRKRGKPLEANKNKKLINRVFVSSIISRVCQLCQFMWNTQDELKKHRDEAHPTKIFLDLMTIPGKYKPIPRPETSSEDEIIYDSPYSEDDPDDDLFTPLPKKKKPKLNTSIDDELFIKLPKQKKRKRNSPMESESITRMNQEAFLSHFGLISVEKLTLHRHMIDNLSRLFVKIEILSANKIPRNGRVFLCHFCNFFDKTRDLINVHVAKKHKLNQATKTGKKRSTTAAGNFVPGKGILIPHRKVLGRGVPINNPNNNASSCTSTTGVCVGAIPPSRSLQRFASLEEFNLRSTVRGQPDISSVPPPPRPDPPRPKSPKPSTSKASKTFIWR